MTVVYIDGVFALNAAADYFLLRLTGLLAGIPPRRGRYLCAALLGGAYACAAFFPGFLGTGTVKCAAGVALALAAFGREERLFRLTALFFAVSCAFAGCVLALGQLTGRDGGLFAYGSGDLRLLGCGALGTCGAALAVTAARRRDGRHLFPVRVRLLDRTAELTALWDSGNGLREDGEPLLVLSPSALEGVLPPDAARLLTADRLRTPETLVEPLMVRFPELRPRLVPYRAVGVASGLLLTVESRWTEAEGARRPGGRIALSPTELGEGVQALWGGGREG